MYVPTYYTYKDGPYVLLSIKYYNRQLELVLMIRVQRLYYLFITFVYLSLIQKCLTLRKKPPAYIINANGKVL